MSTTLSQPLPSFVDRKEEMKRIDEFLKKALRSEGHLLIVHGESGVGKTRLIQEAVEQALSRGFKVGFGAGLSESVIPYQPWTDALRHVGLENILEETPPPKLLALYLLDSEGSVMTKVKLKDLCADTLKTAEAALKQSHGNSDYSGESIVKEGNLVIHALESQRILVLQDKKLGIGALIEGLEDEIFLDDLQELVGSVGSCFDKQLRSKKRDGNSVAPAKVLMRNLLDMGKYGGIDYAQDNPELRRMRLLNNAALGLARKAAIDPILLVLDDIQWVDPSSLALLQYVARNTRKSAVLILSAYRTEEGAVRPHLNSVLNKIYQEDLSTELDLKGLAREHLNDLANSFLGHHWLPEDFIDHLWTETEGNPLFVREVLHRLEDDGAIQLKARAKRLVRPMEKLAIPARVREVIRARLELLPKEDRALLDTAAVCGSRFTASLVAKVAGEEESTVLNGLNNIARLHGLLQPAGYDFAFNHSTVQEVVQEALPEETSRTYHRKVAQWLELAGGPIEDIAEHYYLARDKRALTMLYKAASTAQAKYANEEATRFYVNALELEENPQKRMKILEQLGRVYFFMAEYDKSIESFEKALAFTKQKSKRAGLLARSGMSHRRKGEIEKSMKVLVKSLSLVEGKGCKEEALALNFIGVLYQIRGEFDSALEYHQRALEIGERIGDLQIISSSFNGMGVVHRLRGSDKALEYFQNLVKIQKKIGDERNLSAALNNLGAFYSDRGEEKKALEYYQKALEISERVGALDYVIIQLGNIGIKLASYGQFDRAIEHFKRVLDICERIGDVQETANIHESIGKLRLDMGRYDEALKHFKASLKIRKGINDQMRVATSQTAIGAFCLKTGKYDEALEHFKSSLSITKDSRYSMDNYCGIAEVLYYKKDFKNALKYCNNAILLSNQSGSKTHIARSSFISGMIYREQGQWEESVKDFETSIDIYSSMGWPLHEAKSHFELTKMWTARGNATEAKKHLSKATEIFESLNLEKELIEANALYKTVLNGSKQ